MGDRGRSGRSLARVLGAGRRVEAIDRIGFRAAVLSLTVILAPSSALGQDGSPPGLAALRENWIVAYEKGDAPAMRDLYADDAVRMPYDAPAVEGRDAIIAAYRAQFENRRLATDIELTVDAVTVLDSIAVERGRYEEALLSASGATRYREVGKYVVVARRASDDRWRFTMSIFNRDSAPPATRSPGAIPPANDDGYVTGKDGVRLHYEVLGSGPDTVVVVHGGPGAGIHSVLPDFAPLAKELTLVFYDQRGGGRSTLPENTDDLNADAFVADLDAIRSHFGLERMKLLTHSFGAIVVARYAEAHPTRVERVVLHGATGPVRAAVARAMRRRPPAADTLLARRAGELLTSLLEGTAEDPIATCREYEAIGRKLTEAARGRPVAWKGSTCRMPEEAVAYYYRYTAQLGADAFGDWDFRGRLEDLRAPAMVIEGGDITPEERAAVSWADIFPNAKVLRVEGAGKQAIAEEPDVVVPAIVAFFRG